MKRKFNYLGRTVQIYGLDLFHWYVTIDGSYLLEGDDQRKSWDNKLEANLAAHAFVLALAIDENQITSA